MEKQQYICDVAHDYYDALDKISCNDYSCIILDIMLPRGNGLDILKILKKENKPDGILIISAKNSLDDKIDGLQIGADDYLPKPFHLAELGARVAAIIRRRAFSGNTKIELDQLTLDLSNRVVIGPDQRSIPLTRKEYDLLLYFVSNKNRVVIKEAIVEHLWGEELSTPDNFDFIYAHIKNLRKKITQAGCPDYIKAIYGMGYKLAIPE